MARYGKKRKKYIIELGTKTPLFVDPKQVQLPEDGSRNWQRLWPTKEA